QGIGMLWRGGTCALVGLPPGDFPAPIFDVVLKRLIIRGSIVCTRKDLQEALQFAAEGKVQATVEPQPLEAINEVPRPAAVRCGAGSGSAAAGIVAGPRAVSTAFTRTTTGSPSRQSRRASSNTGRFNERPILAEPPWKPWRLQRGQ
ncbi:MAG TPA: hypothetical protein VFO07_13075, partial [Roseiflexaceae bacterium]|nr:hypothetical protein [Roseiflexaceae bacterium]